MACTVELKDFPTDLGCISISGYVGTIFRKTRYLNAVKLTKKPRVDATLIIAQDVNEVAFLEWWKTELNYGLNPFLVDMYFFGELHTMEFLFISDISEVLKDSNKDNPIQLELMNIGEVLERPHYSYELICDTTIDCDYYLICT